MKVLIVGSLPSSIYNFRGDLIKLLLNNNHNVDCVASGATPDEINIIQNLGISNYTDVSLQRNGLNPFRDLKYFINIFKILKKCKPDILITYTIKPNIFGGIASIFFSKIRLYQIITGIGYSLHSERPIAYLVSFLYKIAFKKSKRVIFQNKDNLNLFVKRNLVPKEKSALVDGSGVNLSFYKKSNISSKNNILMVSRLLGEKGVREYVEAAEIVKKIKPEISFDLIGPTDPSPDGIKDDELNEWIINRSINYLGPKKDIRPHLRNCTLFVLPSYHEGIPRTILEAMAIGRPILTTNVPGCKETVINGRNGWIVEHKKVDELVKRMIWFIENVDRCKEMGDESFKIVQKRFEVSKINSDLMKIMNLQ